LGFLLYVLLGLTADLKSLIIFTILFIIFDNFLCFENNIIDIWGIIIPAALRTLHL